MRHAIPTGRSKLVSIAISACLMIPAAVGAQEPSPLARIQALGLDSTTFGSVPTWFAPADRAAAERLANLLGRASAFFQRELGARVEFRLAALGPAKWIPYFPGAVDTIAWAAEAEALIVAPAWAVRPPPPGFHRVGEFIALHELGHLAANQYFNAGRPLDYGELHWFGEVLATCRQVLGGQHAGQDADAGEARPDLVVQIHRDPRALSLQTEQIGHAGTVDAPGHNGRQA